MEVLKSKDFWINGFIGFLIILFVDWFIGRGWKLFQGLSFLQVTEDYNVHYDWLAMAFIIAYHAHKKQSKA